MQLSTPELSIFVAFSAGLISFFASCFLPLIPTYLAYLTGLSFSQLQDSTSRVRLKILLHSLVFSLGFAVVFVVFGVLASRLGFVLHPYKQLIQQLGGIVLILMGLAYLKVFTLPGWNHEKRFSLESIELFLWFAPLLRSFVIGVIFAAAWSPCIGPVLASILFWAAQEESMAKGILLLSSFSMGLSLPFVLFGLLFQWLRPYLRQLQQVGNWLSIIAGVIMIVAGVLMLFNQFYLMSLGSLYLFNLHPFTP
jgi:cytochrome c-type biogenesis protein